MKNITIYTDGGCKPNPGPGGYGVVLLYDGNIRELSGGFRRTTNNRMEIIAVIKGLEAVDGSGRVKLYSDSQYVVRAITLGWAEKWRANGWTRDREPVPNRDLWERLLELLKKHQVELEWVRGHAGKKYNERCDELATQARQKRPLPIDEGYEKATQRDAGESPEAKGMQGQAVSNAKITNEGQPCRKCGTPVVKKIPKRKLKADQAYYFDYYLECPNCRTMYMVEEAKRWR